MLAAKSRKGRTNSRGRASREQILQSAVDLLQEKGYSGLSIAALCGRAGVAPTSVYWHFANKAGLMEAVLARISGGHVERIRAAVAQARSPGERLERLVAQVRELVISQPLGWLTGVAVVGEGRHVTPELLDALRGARERERAAIAHDFESQLGGTAQQAEALAIVTVAIANYAALCYRMDRDQDEVDRILDSLRSVLEPMRGRASSDGPD